MAKDTTKKEVLERRFYNKGDVLIRQGEYANSAFLIQSGRVQVYTAEENREVDLAVLEAGDIFGEMALVTDEPRNASVRALVDTTVIVITDKVFRKKLEDADNTVNAVVKMLMRRLSDTNKALFYKDKSLREMAEISTTMYKRAHESLPPPKRKTLDNKVLPHLKAFLSAVDEFVKVYEAE